MRKFGAYFLLGIILLNLVPFAEPKRGGVSVGGGRSSGSRGSSAARSGGGLFGGGRSSSSSGNAYSRNTNFGTGGTHSGGGYGGYGQGAGRNQKPSTLDKVKGIFGGGTHKQHGQGGFNRNHGYGGASRYSKSGVGSFVRSNSFKNAIVGAAAGYLTYQAGKAIIRAATSPMMWNNRPYYWGSNNYRAGPGRSNVCRMPIEPGDPQFGNVYFQDNTRPREITWGCDYYEYCCGYECCRGGGGSGPVAFRGTGVSLGQILFGISLTMVIAAILYAITRKSYEWYQYTYCGKKRPYEEPPREYTLEL